MQTQNHKTLWQNLCTLLHWHYHTQGTKRAKALTINLSRAGTHHGKQTIGALVRTPELNVNSTARRYVKKCKGQWDNGVVTVACKTRHGLKLTKNSGAIVTYRHKVHRHARWQTDWCTETQTTTKHRTGTGRHHVINTSRDSGVLICAGIIVHYRIWRRMSLMTQSTFRRTSSQR